MTYEIRNSAGEVVVQGDDRKTVLQQGGELPPGSYTLFKNMGAFTIEERTEAVVRRKRFESTTKRPRAARTVGEPEPIGNGHDEQPTASGGGFLSRLRG
jgi:hypothetical protein